MDNAIVVREVKAALKLIESFFDTDFEEFIEDAHDKLSALARNLEDS